MKKILYITIAALLLALSVLSVSAHSGRLDENGGHYDHSTGEYHYHTGIEGGAGDGDDADYDYGSSTHNSNKKGPYDEVISWFEENLVWLSLAGLILVYVAPGVILSCLPNSKKDKDIPSTSSQTPQPTKPPTPPQPPKPPAPAKSPTPPQSPKQPAPAKPPVAPAPKPAEKVEQPMKEYRHVYDRSTTPPSAATVPAAALADLQRREAALKADRARFEAEKRAWLDQVNKQTASARSSTSQSQDRISQLEKRVKEAEAAAICLQEENQGLWAELEKSDESHFPAVRSALEHAHDRSSYLFGFEFPDLFNDMESIRKCDKALSADFNLSDPVVVQPCRLKSGRHTYMTSLSSCSCESFKFDNHHPCKHMIWLALRLGAIATTDQECEAARLRLQGEAHRIALQEDRLNAAKTRLEKREKELKEREKKFEQS